MSQQTTTTPAAATRDSVLAQALSLSPADREAIADELWLSLNVAGGERSASVEWADEIDRRVAAVKAGDIQGVDPEDFFRRMREKYAR